MTFKLTTLKALTVPPRDISATGIPQELILNSHPVRIQPGLLHITTRVDAEQQRLRNGTRAISKFNLH